MNDIESRISNDEAPAGGTPGRRGGAPGKGRTPVPSWATPEET